MLRVARALTTEAAAESTVTTHAMQQTEVQPATEHSIAMQETKSTLTRIHKMYCMPITNVAEADLPAGPDFGLFIAPDLATGFKLRPFGRPRK